VCGGEGEGVLAAVQVCSADATPEGGWLAALGVCQQQQCVRGCWRRRCHIIAGPLAEDCVC
jgi:hypothetical protein